MNKNGFSLIEALVTVAVFLFIFSALFVLLASSDSSWRIGQNKLIEQQEARKAMNQITRLLRQSNPEWSQSGSSYPVTITSGNRIDFYVPSFNEDGDISAFRKVTFKLDPSDPRQLLKKEGTDDAVVVAQEIEGISFGGGCDGCSAFNCSTVADNCPQVDVEVTTKRDTELDYILDSRVTLRNINIVIADSLPVEQPAEGEF